MLGFTHLLAHVKFSDVYTAYSKPVEKDLHNFVVCEVGEKWYELGIQLLQTGQESKLRLIKTNYRSDVKRCCIEMFSYWLRSHPEASWDQLVKALQKPALELNYLAESIQKKFAGMYIQ